MGNNLNAGQEKCIRYIFDTLDKGDRVVATLSGPAGTGKTFVINCIKPHLPWVVSLAFTNSAAQLIGGSTIHSFFKMTPLDPDAPIVEFSNELSFDGIVKTIIIDECSMIPNSLIKNIMAVCEHKGVNLICVGDEYQLPPVNNDALDEESNECENEVNICFSPKYFTQLKLTEIVRQAKDSSIIEVSSYFRQYDTIPDWDSIATARMWLDKRQVCNVTRSKWKDIEKYWNTDTVILGYTNSAVMQMNCLINNEIHQDNNLFHPNDTIVLKTPIYYIAEKFKDKDGKEHVKFGSLSNGSELQILDAKKYVHEIRTLKVKKKYLNCYKVSVMIGGEIRTKLLLDYDSYPEYNRVRNEYLKEWKKGNTELTKELWMSSGLKGIIRAYHTYASTIHLSQGKTYANVMLMTSTLYGRKQANDINMHNRLAYVACTRPKQKLFLTGAIYK